MPISDQFVTDDAPEWVWGDPSQLAAAQAEAEAASATTDQPDAPVTPETLGLPWLDALMGMVIFLFGQLIVGTIALIAYVLIAIPQGIDLSRLSSLQADHPGLTPAILFPVGITTFLLAWGWSYVGNRTPQSLMSWGFKKTDVLWGLGAVAVSVLVGNVLGLVLQIPAEETAQLNNAIWPQDVSPLLAVALVVGIGFLVPVYEEMIFRGLIQNAIARQFGNVVGLIVGSLVFAIPHIPNFIQLNVSTTAMVAGMAQVTILGFVIGGILIYTRRLGACIAAHIFNNCLAVGTLVYMTFFAG